MVTVRALSYRLMARVRDMVEVRFRLGLGLRPGLRLGLSFG